MGAAHDVTVSLGAAAGSIRDEGDRSPEDQPFDAEVADGRFVGGVAFPPGEVQRTLHHSRDEFEVAIRDPDGEWVAQTEWSNPALTPADPP